MAFGELIVWQCGGYLGTGKGFLYFTPMAISSNLSVILLFRTFH